MAYADRVKDPSTTTGSGNLTLSGTAPTGYQSFNTAFGTGVYFPYTIAGGSEWEVGEGHLSASTTLVRDTIWASSNSGSAVTFSAGTKDVFCSIAANKMPISAYVTSDVTYTSNSTFANITDLSLPVVASGVYRMQMNMHLTNAGFTTGFKVDFNGGSATMTSFRGQLHGTAGTLTQLTALTSSYSNTNFSNNHIMATGFLIVNAGGTFILRGAQASSGTDTTTLLAGSHLILTKLN